MITEHEHPGGVQRLPQLTADDTDGCPQEVCEPESFGELELGVLDQTQQVSVRVGKIRNLNSSTDIPNGRPDHFGR